MYVSLSGRQTKRKLYNEDAYSAVAPKKPKSPQVQNKPKAKKKLTNEDIMKRSSLFKVKELSVRCERLIKRWFQDRPNSYVNKIFDKLEDQNKKRKQEEEEMERFQQTLAHIDEDEVRVF